MFRKHPSYNNNPCSIQILLSGNIVYNLMILPTFVSSFNFFSENWSYDLLLTL